MLEAIDKKTHIHSERDGVIITVRMEGRERSRREGEGRGKSERTKGRNGEKKMEREEE